ncbi:Uma2 family endonuclease [Nostoc sp. FACHB-87]|uniref:Uma2 family endonuclease n=1 Tax=Nostocaceae TaxID=1162 RepID=UPI001684F6B1|nr:MULTISPECIES: Uma2 family endonuclease [Nostocaceae]MBD2299590.1 Uma2 family endonuclease [Nostoc sp. FACHB-190]MBD2459252.1 Uma2 family endonuclease [Nostoc sp. FACHB-87]MBD2478464.1 Uma2 family endonuclease [Anabaena sp. FACHB-83]
MSESIILTEDGLLPEDVLPDVSQLVTEDDAAVDNLPSEKQQRLLTETLYSSWRGANNSQGFLVAANVGLFASSYQPAIVPDVFLSLDVQVAENWWEKRHRSYFFWEFGKPPEVVIEIVSNREGNETGRKFLEYARMRILYYIIFDPSQQLGGEVLQMYELQGRQYVTMSEQWLTEVELGLCLWEGVYEGKRDIWLRWCDAEGNVIPTGAERAEQERAAKEAALQRAERLAAQLRALGVEPEV